MPIRNALLLLCVVQGACTPHDTCSRDGLSCDAYYAPFVTFTFTDTSTGDAYCGPVDISYRSECDLTGERSCECNGEAVVISGSDFEGCHINPPEGERSTITVSAPGYRVFSQDLRLPYECHPTARIDVLLEPL